MSCELLASQKSNSGIILDPRTKLAVLITIAVFILGGSYEGIMQYYITCCDSAAASAGGKKMERFSPLHPDFWR